MHKDIFLIIRVESLEEEEAFLILLYLVFLNIGTDIYNEVYIKLYNT